MRRFLTLVCLLGLALPAGVSISGCVRNPAGKYCNGLGYGPLDTAVASITLQPEITGISLAFGQTIQVQSPTAITCKGATATVASSGYHYGTTNNQLVDISPTGNICAGTWNRNTGGGIPNYTYCNYPSPLPSTNGLPYGIAYITATADEVDSNPVTVYIHPPISSISLVTEPLSGAPSQGCFSQTQEAQLDAEAFYSVNGVQTPLCTPGSTTLPLCANSIGTLNFSVGTSAVASIDAATNVITAEQPGTTVINATIAESTSSAGYFSTCPPASISVGLANGSTKGVVTQGVSQNLQTTIYDTQGAKITGLSLSYQSTNPIDIGTSALGAISAAFPGVASVYATCQPPSCNPAPINELGLYGTGTPLASNPVNVIVPGNTSDFAWFGAPGQSQYFSSIELLTGTPGSTVRLPYVPNSMVMDRSGLNLYFGSQRELMIYSTSSNTLTKQDTTVPGVVLAASPNGSQLLINDQIRGLFYLYTISGGSSSTQGGLGAAAAWTPDSNTLYIVDSSSLGGNHTDTLYVYNIDSGWSSYPLSPPPAFWGTNLPAIGRDLAITVPGVGAYLSGSPTTARTWCPSGNVGDNATIEFYPEGNSVPGETEVLGATLDGAHMLGAELNGSSINLTDIGVSISSAAPNAVCPGVSADVPANGGMLTPLSTNPTIDASDVNLNVPNAAIVNQVLTGAAPTTASVTTAAPVAFVTYTPQTGSTAAAQLPFYLPQTSGAGSVGSVPFCQDLTPSTCANGIPATPPTAPLAGAFSPDNNIFFVSTAGDNAIHFITIPTNVSTAGPTAPSDTQQYLPNLPACTPVSAGGTDAGCLYPTAPAANTFVPVTVVEVKPRSVT
jgi:trimeric autotransporter adhesin